MSLVLTDIQKVTVSIDPVNAAGNKAHVDGAPVWSVSDRTIGTLVVSDDGLSAVFTTTGTLGTCQVNVTADADMGEGMKPVVGVLEIVVTPSEVTTLNVNAGSPESRV